MSSHSFHRMLGALEIDVVHLYARFTVGAAGVATIVSAPGSKGITSIVRSAAGKYVVTLDDAYYQFLMGHAVVQDATNSDPTTVGVLARVFSETVSTPANPGVVTIQFYNVANGSAADPRNGAVVLVKLEMRNSTVI